MKLVKFRVKNYKSIIDSGDCYFSDGITILAGKNESGKTSLLEALEDFDTNKSIRESAIPIQDNDLKPEISVTFNIEKDTLAEIFEEIGCSQKVKSDLQLEVIKDFPQDYHISEETPLDLQSESNNLVEEKKKSITQLSDNISKIHQKYPQIAGNMFEVNYDNIPDLINRITAFNNELTPNLALITEDKERGDIQTHVINLLNEVNSLEPESDLDQKFLNAFKEWIPNFILFNSFEDILPNKIPFSDLENNALVQDLSVISNLEIDKIKSSADRIKHKHKKDINIVLNKDYEKFWTQDISNLSVDWDSESLYFWIEENGYTYEPSLRSKGRQWHLAFYIRVSARARENVPNIILIDEPGLFLHAKAQKDILNNLEESSKEAQIIFSTHSPYLLESKNLNRIRLIYRTKKKGTKIENKIHALADKETLTPIMTAIGLELNCSISDVNKINNVIVEGPSDLYYLEAFKRILNKESLNFIYGGGVGNMPVVGTILHGWGCKVLYLYDNDKGKTDGERNLKDNWLGTKELVLSVLESAGSIEDTFSHEDFKNFVYKKEVKGDYSKNSDLIKKVKADKVLLAKVFLENLEQENITLSNDSINNISQLVSKIESKFQVSGRPTPAVMQAKDTRLIAEAKVIEK